jgi:FMN-dependent NADH-azoreductase
MGKPVVAKVLEKKMKKTLIVSYLPRAERSHTKFLLDSFKEKISGSEVEELNLLEDTPDMFSTASLDAYVKRNYMGEELSAEKAQLLAKMDRMTNQLLAADVVVLAFPMHNFSLPAAVKAWFDSVLLKGSTWDMDDKGFGGLLQGKQAVIIMSSGGVYEGEFAAFDHASTLAQAEFKFMGFEDIELVHLAGTNMFPDKLDDMKKDAEVKIADVAAKLYA